MVGFPFGGIRMSPILPWMRRWLKQTGSYQGGLVELVVECPHMVGMLSPQGLPTLLPPST